MIIRVLTLFPEILMGSLGSSILKNAQEKNLIDVECINIRDFSGNKHKKVDDYPYGGVAGMVMTPQPIFDCYAHTLKSLPIATKPRTIYCSPKGMVFNQDIAIDLAKEESLIFICGHYEGVDQRVIDSLVTDEISIGDYVLTGGELPAAVMIDAISRLIPGVLAKDESFRDESFYSGLLEYPHYTRPQEFRGLRVPEVLYSGNHKEIEKWKKMQSIEITMEKRPDLIDNANLTDEDKKILTILKEAKQKRTNK